MQAPTSTSTPTRSRTSRFNARASVSPSSTRPPGNSHRPGKTAVDRRCVIRYRSSREITAATTRRWGAAMSAMITPNAPDGGGASKRQRAIRCAKERPMVKRVLPAEAAGLLKEGWTYLDVRSVPEFEQGHPAGAVNVPLLDAQAGRMVPDPDFQRVLE